MMKIEGSGSISQRIDPRIRIQTECHGSATLL